MEPDIPLVIPEVNADHLALIDLQRDKGRDGFIVTNPNCSTIMLCVALEPLRSTGFTDVRVATMQASTRRRVDALQLICRGKYYYDAGKGIAGCASVVGAGVCAYGTAQTAGTLLAVCSVTISYGVSKGAVDCLDWVSSSVADRLGYGREWAATATVVHIGSGQWSQAIDKAIDVACSDVRSH
jgi:hypothetical protein